MIEKSDDLVTVDINLNQKDLNESFLGMFGATVKLILQRMFDSDVIVPVNKVRGTKTQIRDFENALVANKNYIQSYIDNGLNNPATYNSKQQLRSAVTKFERETGIRWPFI
tara:strand:- start:165 stop:497 length:333 start_codon:yes stop_codon:yes gene_type:complete